MPIHKGFAAWITCDGKILDEFETRYDADGVKATCWIPSEPGKDFGSQIPSAGWISLDGVQVSGRFLWGSGCTYRSGVRSGPCTERPFSFARIESAASRPSAVPSVQEIGTVILRIKQIQRGDPHAPNRYQVLPPPVSAEWSPTTGGVCAAFGKEVGCLDQYPSTWSSHSYDTSQPGTFAKFVFRYRPLVFLKAQGIADSPSKPKYIPPYPVPVQPQPQPQAPPPHVYTGIMMPPPRPIIPGLGSFVTANPNSVQSIYSMYTTPGMAMPLALPGPQPATGPSGLKDRDRKPARRPRNVSGSTSRSTSGSSVSSVSTTGSTASDSTTRSSGTLRGKRDAVPSPIQPDASSSRLFSEYLNFGEDTDRMDMT